MKALLLTLTVLIVTGGTVRNFISEDNSVTWQKVYDANSSAIDIQNFFKQSTFQESLSVSENGFSFDLHNLPCDYKGVGISKASQPLQVRDGLINASVKVDLKQGKYRVTLSEITIEKESKDELIENEITPIEKFAINSSGQFGGLFKGKPSEILDYSLNNFFSMTVETVNDDW